MLLIQSSLEFKCRLGVSDLILFLFSVSWVFFAALPDKSTDVGHRKFRPLCVKSSMTLRWRWTLQNQDAAALNWRWSMKAEVVESLLSCTIIVTWNVDLSWPVVDQFRRFISTRTLCPLWTVPRVILYGFDCSTFEFENSHGCCLFFVINFYAETLLWSGIKLGPPRKMKFPEVRDIVESVQKAAKVQWLFMLRIFWGFVYLIVSSLYCYI